VLDMLSGKISLAVAKMRMLPGEAIEVRTPNAVAAIRGTTLVVEVMPTPESIRSGKPSDMVTNVHVLTGKVDVFSPGSPKQMVSVGPGFSVSVTGAVLGQLRPTPPTVQFTHGHTPQAEHQQTPDEVKKDMASKQMAKAIAESVLPKKTGSARGEDEGREDGMGRNDKADMKDDGRLTLAVAPTVAGTSIAGSSGGTFTSGGSTSSGGSLGGGLSTGGISSSLSAIAGGLIGGETGKKITIR
jgi:hypothetical protein